MGMTWGLMLVPWHCPFLLALFGKDIITIVRLLVPWATGCAPFVLQGLRTSVLVLGSLLSLSTTQYCSDFCFSWQRVPTLPAPCPSVRALLAPTLLFSLLTLYHLPSLFCFLAQVSLHGPHRVPSEAPLKPSRIPSSWFQDTLYALGVPLYSASELQLCCKLLED